MFFVHQNGGTTTTTTTRQIVATSPNKKALCIGINDYPGTANDLRGCVNDAMEWRDVLINLYGFNVTTLLNSDATPARVLTNMDVLISNAKPNDHIVITYSGHGTNVPDKDGDEPDGRDEAICLYGANVIDDDLRNIIKNLNPEAKLTFISDSCHSGTVTRSFLFAISENVIPRYLPPEDEEEAACIRGASVTGKIMYPETNMKEILLTGCLPTEYSYDASFNGKAYGAMTYYATQILRATPSITYNDFYQKLRTKLPNGSYPQTPCLEGSDENKSKLIFQ